MRRTPPLAALALIFLAAASAAAAADVTRTLRAEIPASQAGAFAVENLAGTMRVSAGSGDAVVAVVTVHSDDAEAADMVTFEKVDGEAGLATYRVRYPIGRYGTFRFPQGEEDSGWSFWNMFGGSSTTTKYDGQRVKVSSGAGVLLYADVEVQVPRRSVTGEFRNVVGTLRGEGLEGKLTFDAGSGDVTLEGLRGEIKADTGSGDVKASDVEGSFSCDTGSGECELSGFKGELIDCDVGSGTIKIASAVARRISADTGSGDVTVTDSDVEEFDADTGSGDVELQNRGGRLTIVSADTGSGDVTLRLGPDASFEATADQGSGSIRNGYSDAQPIVKDKEVVGYKRGDARTRIRVETGSGDLTLEPGS